MAKADLTAQRLRELLHYDPETGIFTWVSPRRTHGIGSRIGDAAGSPQGTGYLSIGIEGRSYLAHRLAWLYMTSQWPTDDVDHLDRVRDNNSWRNLRAATRKQNHENRSVRKDSRSGSIGVAILSSGRWRARIKHNYRQIELGVFDTIEQAKEARRHAEIRYFTHSAALSIQSAYPCDPGRRGAIELAVQPLEKNPSL